MELSPTLSPTHEMMQLRRTAIAGLCLLYGGTRLQAQVTVPIRALDAPQTTSAITFGGISSVRALADGRVLVNDATKRQIVMLDRTLANPVTLIDSSSGKTNSYGATGTALLSYLGDSSLFIDQASQAFVVLDPAGKIGRITPIPGGRGGASYLTSAGPAGGDPAAASTVGVS